MKKIMQPRKKPKMPIKNLNNLGKTPRCLWKNMGTQESFQVWTFQ
jgi:hypothetical protein